MTLSSEKRVVLSGGVRLAAVANGSPECPTIVFIHGYPDTKEEWEPVRTRLASEFRTVAYDVRGAGESSAPPSVVDYDFGFLGDDLAAVLDEFAPGKRVHLVGHDWGGLQGWEFATSSRFEGRLASFTAVAGPSLDQVAQTGRGLLAHGRVVEWLRRARHSWYILFLLLPRVPALIWRFGPSPDQWRRRQLGISPGAMADFEYPRPTLRSDGIHGANLYRRNMPRRLLRPRTDAMADVPVQLIIPARDPFIPEGYYERAEQHAPRVIRRHLDAGHWAQLTHPDQVAGWIRSFVEEVESGD